MTKNIVIAFLLFAYCLLFYLQVPGINFFIFNLLLVFAIGITKPECIRKPYWIGAATAVVLGGLSVFIYGNQLSVIASGIAVAALSAYSFSETKTILLAIVNSAYSFLCGWLLGLVRFFQKRNAASSSLRWGSGAFIKIIVPALVLLVFAALYLNANPILAKLFSQVNLDFISLQFFRFVIIGWALLYGLFYYQQIETVTVYDASRFSNLHCEQLTFTSWLSKKLPIKTEISIGFITLLLLNVLLLLVNILDVNYLFILKTIPADMTYSEYVHQGTNSLIASILLAIAILLYYFRGSLNFESDANGLRVVSFVWIVQNAILVYSTAYRNYLYIQEYSYTYKRIGVMLYLVMCVAGLAFTFYKLIQKKSNWFLVRSCSWLAFALLIILSFFNWDKFITEQNIVIAGKQNRNLDKEYLLSLGYVNVPLLIAEAEKYKHKKKFDNTGSSSFASGSSYSSNEAMHETYDGFTDERYTQQLSKKIAQLLSEENNYGWQSWCIEKRNTVRQIVRQSQERKISKLDFSYNAIESLQEVTQLSPDTLWLQGMREFDLSALPSFKNLQYLNLSRTKADTLAFMPAFIHIKELNLNECSMHQFSFLNNYPQLESLSAQKNLINDCNSLAKVKQLRNIDLSHNVLANITALDSLPQLKELLLVNAFGQYGCLIPKNKALRTLDISNNFHLKDPAAKLNVLNQLKELRANQLKLAGVRDLFHFENTEDGIFHSLTTMELNSNFIEDISLLTRFDQLQRLELSDNKIKSIPVGMSNNIRTLDVSNNRQLHSIAGIADLTQLEFLDIESCHYIKNFEPLQSLTKLKVLNMQACGANTLFPNVHMPALHELDISYNPIDRLDAFASATQLEILDMKGVLLTNIEQLSMFQHLKSVTIDETFSATHREWIKKNMPQVKLNIVYGQQAVANR